MTSRTPPSSISTFPLAPRTISLQNIYEIRLRFTRSLTPMCDLINILRDGKMHVAVKTERDFFELGKSNTDVGVLRQKFLGELRWFTDMIDTLRVEESIYKKEENV